MAAMNKAPVLMCYSKGSIPQLIIVDRYGKVIADSFNGQHTSVRKQRCRDWTSR